MISFRVIAQDRKSFKKKVLKIFINVSILYKKYIYSVAGSPHRRRVCKDDSTPTWSSLVPDINGGRVLRSKASQVRGDFFCSLKAP